VQADDADGPFESCGFAQAGTAEEAPNDLGLDKSDVQRAVKVASISPEAKQAARVAGLDDNRTALLAVAKWATPEAQLAKVGAISSAKTAAKAKNQTAATNVVEANHLTGAVNRFAEFCRANQTC
jgi:hypothetical protein